MTRSQRRLHIRLWSVLGPLILLGFVMALANRPPVLIHTESQDARGGAAASTLP